MKKSQIFILIILLIVLVFVSGQQGCFQQSATEGRTGIDYSIETGIDYLSMGKVLQQGDTFYVGVKIENYDEEPKSGQICIRDNIADGFGGISSDGFGECAFFNIKSADVIEKEVSGFGGSKIEKQITPGKTEVYFPTSDQYSYYGLPEMIKPYSGKLFVSLKYRETTQATATITVPGTEQPILSQDPAPITMSLQKTVRKKQDAYEVSLNIILRKQQQAKIFSSSFDQENVTYFMIEMIPQTMLCTVSGQPITGLIEFENERLIKCSSLIYNMGGQQSYPLVMTLDYGVALEKSYPFFIDTEVE